MLKRSEKVRLGWLVGVLVTGVTIGYFINVEAGQKALPVFNPSDVNPKLVDESVRNVQHDHHIKDFQLLNQEGRSISKKDLESKVYVADFFFTTCQGICLDMAVQMKRVYDAYEDDPRVMFISHSVMPQRDSVSVLAEYAGKQNASVEKWMFLTGEKTEIYDLARKSYFAVTTEGDGGEADFIHTENFILIDTKQRIRGYYDGTSPEDVDRLIQDISVLLKEGDSD
ncbi:MAG: SCO family protein [Flavobacteriales bacterium]|nr:SCO family protein [Flavobacteriales bacterium]